MPLALLLVALSTPNPAPAPDHPAQVILFRHAEEPNKKDDPHLSVAGRAHAQRLVAWFASHPEFRRFGAPAAIYATRMTNDGNGQRTAETVAPLAASLHLPVRTPYTGSDDQKLAKLILGNPALKGKTVIICWNHEEIPDLADALGVKRAPHKWPANVYNRAWVITWKGRRADVKEIPE
ncbi:MAG: histidine phosphatase family protein [Gemmatimonadales bacterium]